jgi:hypothetical protein
MQVRHNHLPPWILILQDTATVIFHPKWYANTALMVLAAFIRMSSVVGHAAGGSILNSPGGNCTEMLMVIPIILFLVGMHLQGCQFTCQLQHRVTQIPPSGLLSVMGHTRKNHNLSQILNGCNFLLVNMFNESGSCPHTDYLMQLS